MDQIVGKRVYRGLLKAVARGWNPKDIQDPAIGRKVLAHIKLRDEVAAGQRLHGIKLG